MSSNVVHGKVYLIQHYVIKFVSDLRQTGWWFSPGTPVSPTNKTDHHNITEILLKVVLNTIKQTNCTRMLVCVEKLPKSEEWCIFIKPESTECVVTSQTVDGQLGIQSCIKASNKKKDTIRNSGVHVDKLFNDYIYKCTCMCNLDTNVEGFIMMM